MKTFDLFPTPVYYYNYDKTFKKEKEFVKKQKTRPNTGNSTSLDNYILKASVLRNIKNFIDESIQDYFVKIYAPQEEVFGAGKKLSTEVYVTQSWINFCKKGQYHHKHKHPNSFISGIFYIEADVAQDKIYFYKDSKDSLTVPPKDFNIYNSDSWWLPVKTGELIIFPSYFEHSVATTKTDNRISLSFNTFLRGSLGNDKDLTGLHL